MSEQLSSPGLPWQVRNLLIGALPEALAIGLVQTYSTALARSIIKPFGEEEYLDWKMELLLDPDIGTDIIFPLEETYEEYLQTTHEYNRRLQAALSAETYIASFLRDTTDAEVAKRIWLCKINAQNGDEIESSSRIVGNLFNDGSAKPAYLSDFTDEHLAFVLKLQAAEEELGWQPRLVG